MATLTIAQVRQRIATGIDAVSGWKESKIPADLFPKEGADVEHKTFTAWSPTTRWEGVEQAPRRRPSGSLTDTVVLVRWLYRIRLDNGIADLDLAYAQEELLIQAGLGVSSTDIHVRVEAANRAVAEGNASGAYVAGEIRFVCKHMFDQSA